MLIVATVISLTLSNIPATSAAWLSFWNVHLGPAIGGHALTVRGWVNEGLMAIFFFVVGLEIKQEFRIGTLATVRKALLPGIAAFGGMITPMGVYYIVQRLMGGGTMAALTVPMATDIAFAMGVLGFFRSAMPAAASAFLLTLATVDDLGAILVLAVVFASNVALPFLGAAAAITLALAVIGRAGNSDLKLFGAGGLGLWYCLLRAGVNSDIAGVLAAFCISTRAFVKDSASGEEERLTERAIKRLAPFTALFVMPLFALANTAVRFGGSAGASAAAAAASAASVAPAAGIAAGLVIGKPLGIFGFTWLADKLGMAKMPDSMNNKHLGIVGMLGGIGFTMCLLLTEVALPASMQTIPKLAILGASGAAALISAAGMAALGSGKK
jgi:NhaA family Na+:H+ antiporter